jgi:hypothetical protein
MTGSLLRSANDETRAVDEFIADHFTSAKALVIEPQSPWEIDPLDPLERIACDNAVAALAPTSRMETYVAMRAATHSLIQSRP